MAKVASNITAVLAALVAEAGRHTSVLLVVI